LGGAVRAAAGALSLGLILGSLLAAGCERLDRNMWDSPAPQAQGEPVRLPPADSIPTRGREHIPSLAEGKELRSPLERSEGNLARGKEIYRVFCVPCHGASGRGDGPIAARYVPTPSDITPKGRGAQYSDGELYVIVSSGLGGMPAFRHDLSPEERWLVVGYVRSLGQTP